MLGRCPLLHAAPVRCRGRCRFGHLRMPLLPFCYSNCPGERRMLLDNPVAGQFVDYKGGTPICSPCNTADPNCQQCSRATPNDVFYCTKCKAPGALLRRAMSSPASPMASGLCPAEGPRLCIGCQHESCWVCPPCLGSNARHPIPVRRFPPRQCPGQQRPRVRTLQLSCPACNLGCGCLQSPRMRYKPGCPLPPPATGVNHAAPSWR